MEKIKTDIAIIGGGAAGLTAAISAAEKNSGLKIAIIERLDRVGKKILTTGNGRCNLSNKNLSDKHYHGSVDAMKIIQKTPDAERFFRKMGVLCTSDSEGRIYPKSNAAATVLGALRIRLSQLGVEEFCGIKVESIRKEKNGFVLVSDTAEVYCRRVIVTAGGYAAPSCGTDGSMMKILRDMGMKCAKICPAVAPLRVKPEELKGLKGVRVKGKVSAVSGGNVLASETGEIQFTENSVSGICVFNLAHLLSSYEGKLSLNLDLFPEYEQNELTAYLAEIQKRRSELEISELLTGIFSRNLATYLTKRALNHPMTNKIMTLKYDELRKVSLAVKSLEFEVSGASSWQNAQVTSGGIHASEITENLESKKMKGLYFAGEILDVDGDCGGYNLQWAWSSGIWAGENCAKSLSIGAENGKNK